MRRISKRTEQANWWPCAYVQGRLGASPTYSKPIVYR
nr:MAG TPA: hypothetical protein [Caudoviricetes sp.]